VHLNLIAETTSGGVVDRSFTVGAVPGVLATKAWIDSGYDVTWLNDHDNQPGLMDFVDRTGTDPPVQVFDVDTSGPSILLAERATVPLSELSEEDRA
jgi:hypothetical protein